MKKILLLGGSSQQVKVIETAKAMGYFTVLCDYLPDNPGQYAADKFYLASTTDQASILQIAKEEQIDGILAYASDPAAPTAAYIAEQLSLAGNPYESVKTLCNKDLFREFLRKHDFNTPKSYSFSSSEAALRSSAVFTYPLIIKPVDSSGSKGATVLHSADGLSDSLDFAFSFSRCHKVIIEEYISKKHPYLIGGDIFIVNGEIKLWGLLNCHRDFHANPLVPVGKSFPLELDTEDTERIMSTLSALVHKLNICNGSMNVELVIDEHNRVWPIDIGPRSGGNMIPDLLGDIFGIDIEKMSILAAMGETIPCNISEPEGCFATHNLHSIYSGTYQEVLFSPEIMPYIYRTCFYKKAGDPVEYFDNASKCLGIIFMKFPNTAIRDRILNRINDFITIKLQ